MTDNLSSPPDTAPVPQADIVAGAGRYFRNTRYLMTVLLLGFGIWCIRDGFFEWPRQIAAAQERREKEPHSRMDVLINQFLGIVLPPAGLFMLGWTLYRSRGVVRFSKDTLHVPGHPPVPLSAITGVDDKLWERKGIAFVSYQLPTGLRGTLRLDDFIYDRPPIDQIYERIQQSLGTAGAS